MVDSNFKQISDSSLNSYVKSQIDKGHELNVISEFLVRENIDPDQISRVLESFNPSGLSAFDSKSSPKGFFEHHKGLFMFGGVLLLFVFGIFLFLSSVDNSFSDEVSLVVLSSDVSPSLGSSDLITLSNVTYSSKGNSLFFSFDKDLESLDLTDEQLFLYFSNEDESQSLMIPFDDSFNLKNGKFKFDPTYLKNEFPSVDFSLFDSVQLVVRPAPKPIDAPDEPVDDNVIVVTDEPNEIYAPLDSDVVVFSSGGASGGGSGGSSGGTVTSSSSGDTVTTSDSVTYTAIAYSNPYLNYVSKGAFFNFDETYTATYDSEAKILGSFVGEVSRVDSFFGKSLKLQSKGYVDLGTAFTSNIYNSSLSLAMWVNPSKTGSYQGLVMQRSNTTLDSFALYLIPNSKSLGFKTQGTTNSWLGVTNLTSLFDGGWHYLVATYDGSRKVVYIDAKEVASIDATGYITINSGFKTLLGSGPTEGSLLYNGSMDQLFISSEVLSLDDVKSMYVNHYGFTLPEELVVCTPFAETCNGLDDNCNGIVDDGGNALCSTGYACQGVSGCVQDTVLEGTFFGLDETSGTTIYDTTNTLSATLMGSVSRVNNAVFGKALNFTGSGYVVLETGSQFDYITNKLSMSVWIDPTVVNTGFSGLIYHPASSGDTFGMYIDYGQKTIGVRLNGASTGWKTFLAEELFSCDWHNVVVTYDGSKISFYLDGNLKEEVASTGNIKTGEGQNMYFASTKDGASGYKGLMDEIALFNYSLTSLQVSDLFDSYNYISPTCGDVTDPVVDPVQPNVTVSACPSGATCYYVSSTGSDTNNGLSESSPIKTISKVNTLNLQPGNYVLFKKGDTFYGTLDITHSGNNLNQITFSSYGQGEKPIITGFTTVTGWTNLGGNIWESTNAVSTLDSLNMVVINGKWVARGRTPNKVDNMYSDGDFFLMDHTDVRRTSLTSSEIAGLPNLVGAEVVLRSSAWKYDYRTISSMTSNSISWSSSTSYDLTNGEAFYIQKSPLTLDKQDEWYYDTTTHKLKVYSTTQPTNVKVASLDNLVVLHGNNLTFTDLHLVGTNEVGFLGRSIYSPIVFEGHPNGYLFDNLEVNYVGGNAIHIRDGANFTVQNSIFTDMNIGGVYSIDSENVFVRDNVFNRTFLYGGMDPTSATYSLVVTCSRCENVVFEYNEFYNSGQTAINPSGANPVLVKNNFVDTSTFIIDDAGGIHAGGGDGTQNKIIGNIILNTYGADEKARGEGVGMYLDTNGVNWLIENNTVFNSSNYLLLNNGGSGNIFNNNKFIMTPNIPATIRDFAGYTIHDNTITNNIFLATMPWPALISYSYTSSTIRDQNDYYDYNYYIKPISSSSDLTRIISATPSGTRTFYTLTQWQDATSFDDHSTVSTYSNFDNVLFEYNPSKTSKTITLSGTYYDVDGNAKTGSVTIPPYGSVVLFRDLNHVEGDRGSVVNPPVEPDSNVLWQLSTDSFNSITKTGGATLSNGIVTVNSDKTFTLPASILGSRTQYTIELEVSRPASNTLGGGVKLFSNQDDTNKKGIKLVYYPPTYDAGWFFIDGYQTIEERGFLPSTDYIKLSFVNDGSNVMFFKDGLLEAITASPQSSSLPLVFGGRGDNYGYPDDYKIRNVTIYSEAIAPSGYDPTLSDRYSVSGPGYMMERAFIDDPTLPRILIIGDSISMGYRGLISDYYDGLAYVDYWVGGAWNRPSDVLGDDSTLKVAFDGVLSQGPYDVITWNPQGLHTWILKDQPVKTPEELYPQMIDELASHLDSVLPASSNLLFITTTPVVDINANPLLNTIDTVESEFIIKFNPISVNTMANYGFNSIDLYALAEDNLQYSNVNDGIHWQSPFYESAKNLFVSVINPLI